MNILDFLVEPLTLPFMLRAFVVTVLAAAVCALLSCWLVLRPSQWVRWLPPSWR